MKHFEAMMRDFLLEKQRTRMQNKAAQPENQVHVREIPQLCIRWISDGSLQTESVTSEPSDLAAAIVKHQHDGELSICTPEYMELLIANEGYVLMCSDIAYWQEVNEALNMIDLSDKQDFPENSDIDFEIGGIPLD